MLSKIIYIFLILLNALNSFSQNKDVALLKHYDFFIERNIEMGNWSQKYILKDGYIVIKEDYWKNELRSRTIYEYDTYHNIISEINTYDINLGHINDISHIKLIYNNSTLIGKEFDSGIIEKYADFNKFGKPQLVERVDKDGIWPYKEIFEYDDFGNIIKSSVYSSYFNPCNKIINEIETTYFKYDESNNIVEINREFEPKQPSLIIKIGGLQIQQHEFFKYKYNKNGLWTKKYRIVNGKKKLILIRKYS